MRMQPMQRRAATMVESAIVYPVTFFIILSLIIGAMGIFRYQEMAALAREASRFGASHGAQFRKDAGLAVGTGGVQESAGVALNTSASPYNTSPWNTLLFFRTHPTEASGTYSYWADYIYDNSVRTQLVMLDPASLQMWIGWTPVLNQPTLPDNYPGSRICATIRYPVFPEAFIWWNPDATKFSVSTSPMPITN